MLVQRSQNIVSYGRVLYEAVSRKLKSFNHAHGQTHHTYVHAHKWYVRLCACVCVMFWCAHFVSFVLTLLTSITEGGTDWRGCCLVFATGVVTIIELSELGELLEDLCEVMTDGSLCAMGGLTPLPVRSALKLFPADFGIKVEVK